MDYRLSDQRSEDVALRRVWDGMIPIELQLAAADAIELLASAVLPEPFQTFYMLMPRLSYLPFTLNKIREQWLDPMFALSGPRPTVNNGGELKDTEMWFEYRGQALKWHYPLGLLYDMLVGQANGEAELPWSLILHVRRFPITKLVAQPSVSNMRDMFMAMIKESDFIRNGSTKRVMDLAKSDQVQFLDGLESHSFEKYFAIHSIIVPGMSDTRAVSSKGSRSQPKAIPVKFYMQTMGGQDDAAHGADRSATAGGQRQVDISLFHVTQFPVPLTRTLDSQADVPTTVADAFRMCYEIAEQSGDAFVNNCACLSQGICLPWETPISWLAENLFYADCFLHLVVISV
ncbi:autophagy protein 5 [Coemansia sp. Benny D115]|nr:autophagy protein 5 [Coemansia sp. Benny D115]